MKTKGILVKRFACHKFWYLIRVKTEKRGKEVRKMEAVGSSCFSSVFVAPPESDVLLKKKKVHSQNHIMVSKNSFESIKIYCKAPESEIEECPTRTRPSNSRNKIEEYNIAMRRMMRNPYEYHHDLGQSLLHPILFLHSHFIAIFGNWGLCISAYKLSYWHCCSVFFFFVC